MRTSRARPRRGIVLIILLATFAIAVALCGAWTRSVLRNRQQLRLAEEQIQVEWLTEAAVRRAAALLAADPAYAGETWQVAAAELARPNAAAVVIRVDRLGGSGAVQITTRASYPRKHPRVRQTKTIYYNPIAEQRS